MRLSRDHLLALLDQAETATDFSLALVGTDERRLLRRCALARRFNRTMLDEVLRDATGITADEVSFDRLSTCPGVGPEPGRPDWYRVEIEDRSEIERAWLDARACSADGDELGEPAFRVLNGRLADWFAGLGPDGELEELYHRLVADLGAATSAFHTAYERAANQFDLARCKSLIGVLDERARFLDPRLASFRTDARGLLRARSAVADDYFATARYLQRAHLAATLDTLLVDKTHFILNLHGAGGSGKTMFLRWLSARFCLPRQIPVARVDFDFLDETEAGLEPRFFFGKLAEKLNLQLRALPFTELVDVVREMRRAALSRRADGRRTGLQSSELEEQEVKTRFATVLEENCRGQVLLLFDTLEDAYLKHGVDLRKIVDAIREMRELIAGLAAKSRRNPPHVAIILSGRYALQQQDPQLYAAYEQAILLAEATPFDPEESRKYLLENRAVPDSRALAAAVRRANGSPFKLMLYADVLLTSPRVKAAEMDRLGRIDLLYLMERVLKRIPDYPLRWVLRYGVLARRLTRQFLEEVLGPHLRRAMRGDKRYDDPAVDEVSDAAWPALWYAQDAASRRSDLDYDLLWKHLRDYASASSWIMIGADAPNALLIQPVVTHPMRRVLRKKPVVRLIQRSAIRELKALIAKMGETENDRKRLTEQLKSLTYYEFQFDPERAARTWRWRVRRYRGNQPALQALATVVLSEDLRETEAEAQQGEDAVGLVPPDVEARARFALAEAAFCTSTDAGREEQLRLQDAARRHLQEFDAQRASQRGVVPLITEATLRWNLANDAASQERALAQLSAAERSRISPQERKDLLFTLERGYATHDSARAETYARASARLARRRGDADAFGEAVISLIGYQTAREAYRRGLAECLAARIALRARGWSTPGDARRKLRECQVALEAQCGLVATAHDHIQKSTRKDDRTSQRAGAMHDGSEAGRRKLAMASLLVACDQPIAARTAARSAVRYFEASLRAKPSDAVRRSRRLMLIRCLSAEADVLRRLMEFGPALDLYQRAQVEAGQAAETDEEVCIRLKKARTYLFYIGDLRQAEEILQGSDVSFEAPDLRLQHRLLRASLCDRLGNSAEAESLLRDACEQVQRGTDGAGRVATALSALALDHLDHRLPYLEMLRDGLAAFDHGTARVARLRALRYCNPVSAVPAPLTAELIGLAEISPLGGSSYKRIAPADRLGLTLLRIELLRVLGEKNLAVEELRSLRGLMTRYPQTFRDRDVALACDRLGLWPDEALPTNWLTSFERTFRDYHALRGVALLEEAERLFRRGSTARSRQLANLSRQHLEHPDAVRSVFNARGLTLLADLAREGQDRGLAAELQVSADRAIELMGREAQPAERASLVNERRDAWAEQLRDSEVLGMRIDGPARAMLVSYARTRPAANGTPRPVDGPLRHILEQLASGPLGGSASFPLIETLSGGWKDFGQLLGRTLLPNSLRAAISSQLRRSPMTGRGDGPHVKGSALAGLDVVLECERSVYHAVPWELTVLDEHEPRPVVGEAGVRQVWRAGVGMLVRERARWAQAALARLMGGRVVIDGIFGPVTKRALEDTQRMLKLPADGLLDTRTRLTLREALRARRPRRPGGPAVLLVRARAEEEMTELRGFASRGTDLDSLYRERGFDVTILDEPDPSLLQKFLHDRAYDVLHLAAPVAESRHGNELYLRFGSSFSNSRSLTGFTSKVIASLLSRQPQGGPSLPQPIVILDVPKPPSPSEALRQLALRNVFASHLFLLGRLPAVLASGLADPLEQLTLSRCLIDGLAERAAPGDLARTIRIADGIVLRDPTSPLLATACVALFASDPDLAPEDMVMIA